MDYQSIAIDDNYDAVINGSWREFIEQGDRRGCFGPIRFGIAEPTVPTDVQRYSIIAHLRDPRDVLTSLYYSHVYSHGPRRFDAGDAERQTWQELGVDRFVLDRIDLFRERYEVFCSKLLGREHVTLLKYEMLVTDYATWLEQFLQGFADWAAPEHPLSRFWQRLWNGQPHLPSLSKLHGWFYEMYRDEFRVVAEDAHQHKRRVIPGDHRRKLRPETISKLNMEFRGILHALGYATLPASETQPASRAR